MSEELEKRGGSEEGIKKMERKYKQGTREIEVSYLASLLVSR